MNISNSREDTSTVPHEILQNDNSHSLKGRLMTLELMFDDIGHQMTNSKEEILRLMRERQVYENLIEETNVKDKNELFKELESVMKDMETYFERQKHENEELQLRIARLKTQKTVLQGKFIALQRRITNLEVQVGNELN